MTLMFGKTELNLPLLELVVSFAENNENFHQQGVWMHMSISDVVVSEGGEQRDAMCSTKETPEAVKEYIEENVCGTSGCIGGWGAIFSGWCQVRDGYKSAYGWYENPIEEVVNPADGRTASMSEAAREEFGLSYGQAEAMFAGDNKIAHIREMVEALRADPNADLFPYRTAYRLESETPNFFYDD